MKKEEIKKQDELKDEQLDNAAGGKFSGCGPITKKIRGLLK
jgi:hypothetical protein